MAIRDEDWWDAVGKDMWRWQQELDADEAEQKRQQEALDKKVIDNDDIIK